MAIGDLISQEEGQIVLQRVLPVEHGLTPPVETNYRGAGQLLGVRINDLGTFVGRMRADGTLYGSGQGLAMSATGDSASWQAQGVGSVGPDGSIRWVGSVIFDSTASAFAGLRGVAGVFEWEATAEGAVVAKIWAWQ